MNNQTKRKNVELCLKLYSMFEKCLKDNYAIADYISSVSPSYTDINLMLDYFWGYKAILREVNIHQLNSGKIEANLQDIKKENSYFSKPLETMPPIVVKDNQIEDGNHRYRVCKRKNVKTILIYDVINIENE